MDQTLWQQRAPRQRGRRAPLWTGEPTSLAALSGMRAALRTALDDTMPDDDGLDRLLLVFEELVSNALRHGGAPVHVAVHASGSGWLLTVTDGAGDTAPVPAVGRDAAAGGHGLYMAARLATSHGWTREGRRKTVWAVVEPVADRTPAAYAVGG